MKYFQMKLGVAYNIKILPVARDIFYKSQHEIAQEIFKVELSQGALPDYINERYKKHALATGSDDTDFGRKKLRVIREMSLRYANANANRL